MKKIYEYRYVTINASLDGPSWVTKLNEMISLNGEHEGYRLHSITDQGIGNNKTYYKNIVLEKYIEHNIEEAFQVI